SGKIVFIDSHGQPVPHLRYAVSDSWLVIRGGASTATVDGSIRFVATRISASKFFDGEKFSWGDQFIADCASGSGTAGYSTIWRAANMNRHISRAINDIGRFLGREVEQPEARYSPLQEVLKL